MGPTLESRGLVNEGGRAQRPWPSRPFVDRGRITAAAVRVQAPGVHRTESKAAHGSLAPQAQARGLGGPEEGGHTLVYQALSSS